MFSRWQEKTLLDLMQVRRVLLLVGPRQSGKTTLARQLASQDVEYLTLDDEGTEDLANDDPKTFVRHDKQMLIIDEVQRSPGLLRAIKLVVDEDNRPGQFLITGSANVSRLPSVTESLAGRVARIRLRPLSQGEITGGEPEFISRCFNQDFIDIKTNYSRDEIIAMALRGGFPEVLGLERDARVRWHEDYVGMLLDRDLADLANIRKYDAMRDLVTIMADFSAQRMDISKIGTKLAIKRDTLESYLNNLELLFMIDRVQPWTKTDHGRVGKQKKIFMNDSGLMASLLNLRAEHVRLGSNRGVGPLLETFVYNELAAQLDFEDGDYSLYHYRDHERREVDFIIERRSDGAILALEVKSSANYESSDAKQLKWFRDNIAGDRPFTGVLLYTGDVAGSMGDNLWLQPFGALWNPSARP